MSTPQEKLAALEELNRRRRADPSRFDSMKAAALDELNRRYEAGLPATPQQPFRPVKLELPAVANLPSPTRRAEMPFRIPEAPIIPSLVPAAAESTRPAIYSPPIGPEESTLGEAAIESLKTGLKRVPTMLGNIAVLSRSMEAATPAGLAKTVYERLALGKKGFAARERAKDARALKLARSVEQWAEQKLPGKPLKGRFTKPAENFLDYVDPKRVIKIIGENAPQMGVFIGSTLINPFFGAAAMFGAEGGDVARSFAEMEAEGAEINPIYKRIAPITVGAFNAALESAGVLAILKTAKVRGLKQKIMQFFIAEATESTTEGVQGVNAVLAESGVKGKISESLWNRFVEDAYAGLIIGIAASSGAGAAGSFLDEQAGLTEDTKRAILSNIETSRRARAETDIERERALNRQIAIEELAKEPQERRRPFAAPEAPERLPKDVIYNGVQEDVDGKYAADLYTDLKTGSTFAVNKLKNETVKAKLAETRQRFAKAPVREVPPAAAPIKPKAEVAPAVAANPYLKMPIERVQEDANKGVRLAKQALAQVGIIIEKRPQEILPAPDAVTPLPEAPAAAPIPIEKPQAATKPSPAPPSPPAVSPQPIQVEKPKVEAKPIAPTEAAKDAEQVGGTASAEVANLPIGSIATDVDRFQNRATSFSEKTAATIAERYDPNKLDPIVVWRDPKDGKPYVISGHSRLEGLKRRGERTISSRYFQGTEEQATNFARLEANRLGTAENLSETLKAYESAKKQGYDKKRMVDLFDGDIGLLEDISALNKKGDFINILGQPAATEFPYIRRFARWVGTMRRDYGDKFTDRHEQQLFDFLYKDDRKNREISRDDFFNLVDRQVQRLDFDPNAPLILKRGEVPKVGTRARADTARFEEQLAEHRRLRDAARTIQEREVHQKDIDRLQKEIAAIVQQQPDLFGETPVPPAEARKVEIVSPPEVPEVAPAPATQAAVPVVEPKPARKPFAAPKKGKEAWEMTLAQWQEQAQALKQRHAEIRNKILAGEKYDPNSPIGRNADQDAITALKKEIGIGDIDFGVLSGAGHKARIRQALSEGKPVPPSVLADYPDLQKPTAVKKSVKLNREWFKSRLQNLVVAGRLKADEIELVDRTTNLFAQRWAEWNGRTADEFYGEAFEEVRASALAPKLLVDKFRLPEGTDLSKIRIGGQVDFTTNGKAVIDIFEEGNLTTLLHDLLHVFRRYLPESDARMLRNWAEQRELSDEEFRSIPWTREAEERLAAVWEKYLTTGEAPNEQLRPVFERLKQLLRDVYQLLQRKEWVRRIDLKPYVKAAFDRMLTPGLEGREGRAEAAERGGVLQSIESGQPIFFSQMQRVLEQKLPNSGPAEQMRQLVNNFQKKGDFKKEEWEWSGVDEWLAGKSGKVTKQEVAEFLRENEVQVEEKLKGKLGTEDERNQAEENVRAAEDEYSTANDKFRAAARGVLSETDITNIIVNESSRAAEALKKGELGNSEMLESAKLMWNAANQIDETKKAFRELEQTTKFAQWQLPGGENYRELLLTLPIEPSTRFEVRPFGSGYGVYDTFHAAFLVGGAVNRDVAEREVVEINTRGGQGFRGAHFAEPNILAHVRFNERTDADGKRMLFIEEVQSDWHQEGRKKGYKGDNQDIVNQIDKLVQRQIEVEDDIKKLIATDPTIEPLVEKVETAQRAVRNAVGLAETIRTKEERDYLEASLKAKHDRLLLGGEREEIADIRRQIKDLEYKRASAVPDVPFKTTWHELAMKRMMRYAAENSFERIGWTTGEQQAERYDLRKQLSAIDWRKNADGTYWVQPVDKDNRAIGQLTKSNIQASELEDLIGKDAAKRIVESPNTDGSLTGENLAVGGEGMKGFYDQILPSFVNKFAKKWGGRVGTVEIHAPKYEEARTLGEAAAIAKIPPTLRVHSIDITTEMQEGVLQGLPLFSIEAMPEDARRESDAHLLGIYQSRLANPKTRRLAAEELIRRGVLSQRKTNTDEIIGKAGTKEEKSIARKIIPLADSNVADDIAKLGRALKMPDETVKQASKTAWSSIKNIVKRYLGNRRERYESIFEDKQAAEAAYKATIIGEAKQRIGNEYIDDSTAKLFKDLKKDKRTREAITLVLEGIPDDAIQGGKVVKFGSQQPANVLKVAEKLHSDPKGTVLTDGRIVGDLLPGSEDTYQLWEIIPENIAKKRFDDLVAKVPEAEKIIVAMREAAEKEIPNLPELQLGAPAVGVSFNTIRDLFDVKKREELDAYTPDVLKEKNFTSRVRIALSSWTAPQRGIKTGVLRTKFAAARELDIAKLSIKSRKDFLKEHVLNQLVSKLIRIGAKPVPEGGVPDGWVKVGTGVLSDATRLAKMWKQLPEEMGKLDIADISEEGDITLLKGRRGFMVPKALIKEIEAAGYSRKRTAFISPKTRAIADAVDDLIGDWLQFAISALLLRPSTTMRNQVSGKLQSTAKVVEDFWRGVGKTINLEQGSFDDLIGDLQGTFHTGWVKKRDIGKGLVGRISWQDFAGDDPSKIMSTLLKPFNWVEINEKRLLYTKTLNALARRAWRTELAAGRVRKEDQRAFMENFAKSMNEDVFMQAYEQAGTYAFNYENKPAFIRALQKSKIGRSIFPFPNYIYQYFRLVGRYYNPKNLAWALPNISAEERVERFARFATAATLTGVALAVVGALDDDEQAEAKREGLKVDYSVDTSGRLKVAESDATEYWLRIGDLPFLGDALAYKQMLRNELDFSDYVTQRISTGPLMDGFMVLNGAADKYQKYKPAGTQVGKAVEPMILPFLPYLQYMARVSDDHVRQYWQNGGGFWENFGRAIADDIPKLREMSPPRLTRDKKRLIETDRDAEHFKFWLLNVKQIDKADKAFEEAKIPEKIIEAQARKDIGAMKKEREYAKVQGEPVGELSREMKTRQLAEAKQLFDLYQRQGRTAEAQKQRERTARLEYQLYGGVKPKQSRKQSKPSVSIFQ